MVHHNLGEPIVHVDAREHRRSRHRVHRLVHQRVPPDETDHLIREVPGGLYERIVGLAWALNEREQEGEGNFREGVQVEIEFSAITFVKTVIVGNGFVEEFSKCDRRLTEYVSVGKHQNRKC